MAKVSPLKPADYGFTLVECALSKAQPMAWALEELGAYEGSQIRNDLIHALQGDHVPEYTRDWLHGVVGEALRAALDDIEAQYRKPKDGE